MKRLIFVVVLLSIVLAAAVPAQAQDATAEPVTATGPDANGIWLSSQLDCEITDAGLHLEESLFPDFWGRNKDGNVSEMQVTGVGVPSTSPTACWTQMWRDGESWGPHGEHLEFGRWDIVVLVDGRYITIDPSDPEVQVTFVYSK